MSVLNFGPGSFAGKHSSPEGGIMFEKVLKSLCPCYFNRKSNESAMTSNQILPSNNSDSKQTSSCFRSTGISNTTTDSADGIWKGTLNFVQPQPVYAFPGVDLKNSAKKTKRNLLKPPLYWEKATKTLQPEGPPVFEETKNGKKSHLCAIVKKKKALKGALLKNSETVENLSAVSKSNTVEIQKLKSQSLDDILHDENLKKNCSRKKNREKHGVGKGDGDATHRQVLSDFSHGVILFTAVYFNKKKTCMINIDRLENLLKKGKEKNTYYSIVKVGILPSEKYVRSTKVLANLSNPEVKEDFSFSVKELTGKVLRFSVFDASLQKKHEAVGHALLTLEDIICDQPKKYRIKLYKRSQPHVCPGKIWLSLNYFENEDKFSITVYKAQNLTLQKEKKVKMNTFVKVTLYSYGEKIKTKKSVVVLDSRNPNYNTTFTFQVRKDLIDYLSVSLTVKLKGFVNDLTIGRLNFGPFFYFHCQNLTPWGRVFLSKEFVSHWFCMYL